MSIPIEMESLEYELKVKDMNESNQGEWKKKSKREIHKNLQEEHKYNLEEDWNEYESDWSMGFIRYIGVNYKGMSICVLDTRINLEKPQ